MGEPGRFSPYTILYFRVHIFWPSQTVYWIPGANPVLSFRIFCFEWNSDFFLPQWKWYNPSAYQKRNFNGTRWLVHGHIRDQRALARTLVPHLCWLSLVCHLSIMLYKESWRCLPQFLSLINPGNARLLFKYLNYNLKQAALLFVYNYSISGYGQ